MKTIFPLICALFLASCVSSIGKTPTVRCEIFQSRSYWMTGLSIGAAALATGLGAATLPSKSERLDHVLVFGGIGSSASAATLGWFGREAGDQAANECKALTSTTP